MSLSRFVVSLSLLAGAVLLNGGERVPVLLELFTSEGCSSCPPADQLLERLDQKQPVAGADLIVLSEHVDYWDRLGWKDPFSSAQFSARQEDYTERYHFDGVYTPQLVVDGHYAFVGSDERAASSAIEKAIREQKLEIALTDVQRLGDHVNARIELTPDARFRGARGVLYLAVADNRRETQVKHGENSGRTLAHVAVTRVLKQLATVDLDRPFSQLVTLPASGGEGSSGSRLVAFLQDSKSGRVLGAVERGF